jgi:tRNA threonylcarbamoyladenosine biosynthesis protein TsaE
MIQRVFHATTPEQTIAAGEQLGRLLRPGDFVVVSGELGCGKTTFIQGLVCGYGIDTVVTSPSFALLHVYEAEDRGLIHADPYRLAGPEDVLSTGLDDYIGGPMVIAVEWPERLGSLVPEEHIVVDIHIDENEARTIVINAPDRFAELEEQ